MPQIGWFEILIVVVLSIIIIGPKDFPFMLKKIGTWISSFKNYFNDFKKDLTDIQDSAKDSITFEKDINLNKDKKNKNE
tara:strand:- start:295 stop:531 length:237 start_codon:yes stop_codon:yes gene_type:complete